jgi:hypothetical protein
MDWTGYRQTLVIILAQATGDAESRRQFGLTGKVEFLFIAFYVGRVGLEPTTGGL